MTSKPVHIIHVIPEERGGGAELLVGELQRHLTATGVSCERVHFCGARLETDSVTCFGSSHNSISNIPRLRALLRQRLSGRKTIILHTHLTHAFYAGLVASLGLPLIRVHTEHSTTMRLREIRWMRPIEKRLYERCNKVIAISEGVHTALKQDLKLDDSLIETIQNGSRIYPLVLRAPVYNNTLNLVSVGSLTHRKGFDVAIIALARARIGNWIYRIVGEGPELATLKQIAHETGVSDRVIFSGWSDDPAPFLNEAHLQLIPSRWEGFGLVAVEGMSTGLCQILSDVSGLRDVVVQDSSTCFLVKNNEKPNAWVEPLERFSHALRLAETPTSNLANIQAQKFGIDKMVSSHMRLYEKLSSQAI